MPQAQTLAEPSDVDPAIADGLRREVGWLRRVEQRRVFPVRLHLGRPGSPRSIGSEPLGWLSGPPWPLPGWVDAGTRRDMAAELAASWAEQQGAEPAWCWLSRPGRAQTHDEDPALVVGGDLGDGRLRRAAARLPRGDPLRLVRPGHRPGAAVEAAAPGARLSPSWAHSQVCTGALSCMWLR